MMANWMKDHAQNKVNSSFSSHVYKQSIFYAFMTANWMKVHAQNKVNSSFSSHVQTNNVAAHHEKTQISLSISLIRIFSVCKKKVLVQSYPLSKD